MIATYEQQMMTEALEEHDNGCCTATAPCTWRRGITKVLESKKLTPDVRATENAPMRTGSGRGFGQKAQPTGPQVDLWTKLMGQMRDMGQSESADKLQAQWDAVKNRREFSSLIDAVIKVIRKTKEAAKNAAPEAPAQKLTPGMYSRDGKVYKVVTALAGHVYAKVLRDGDFEFAPGALKMLDATHRMSLEDAKAYGRKTGTCCSCGRELTNPESIEAGIGPICAGRF